MDIKNMMLEHRFWNVERLCYHLVDDGIVQKSIFTIWNVRYRYVNAKFVSKDALLRIEADSSPNLDALKGDSEHKE